MKISIKIIKYTLNLLGLIWILFITDLSYAFFTGSPNFHQAMNVILCHIPKLASSFYFPFLICFAGLNYLIDKKTGTGKEPREYHLILVIQFLIILTIAVHVSKLYFDNHCS